MNTLIWGITALLIALIVALLSGGKIISALKKASFGQEIREEGPAWHKKKSGTPTMGAFIFASGFVFSVIFISAVSKIFDKTGLTVIITALLFGAVGFLDDYIKVIKKRNLGLTAGKKFLAQALVSVAFSLVLYDFEGGLVLLGASRVNLSYFAVIFNVFVMLATVNAVNLTDGIDGLAGSTTAIAMAFFAFAAYIMGFDMLFIILFAVIGGVLGFLYFNKYPAKVFMGDTGSLFLGGLIGASACAMGIELTLIAVGFVFFFETLSVIIQVTYFKATGGKRVFLMTPIHHHFEKKGWSEKKIVSVASAITLFGALIGALYITLCAL